MHRNKTWFENKPIKRLQCTELAKLMYFVFSNSDCLARAFPCDFLVKLVLNEWEQDFLADHGSRMLIFPERDLRRFAANWIRWWLTGRSGAFRIVRWNSFRVGAKKSIIDCNRRSDKPHLSFPFRVERRKLLDTRNPPKFLLLGKNEHHFICWIDPMTSVTNSGAGN